MTSSSESGWCCLSSLFGFGSIITISALVAAYYFVKKHFSDPKSVHKTDYKKDVVYLYQFPRMQNLPNVSPFCLKLETFLRVNKIHHEVVYTTFLRSEKGLLPFVELNGAQIADSEVILSALSDHFKIKESGSEKEQALGHAVAMMINYRFFCVSSYFKFFVKPESMIQSILSMVVPGALVPLMYPLVKPIMQGKFRKRIGATLGGVFERPVFEEMLRRDLRTLQTAVKDNKYLGGNEISTADAIVFGHLGSTIFGPVESFPRELITAEFPEIVAYTTRIRDAAFPKDFVIS